MTERSGPQPAEAFFSRETHRQMVNPVVAKIIETQASETSTGVKLNYNAINELSFASRSHYYAEKTKQSFDQQNMHWNTGLWNWIQKKTAPNELAHEERIATLASVGIDHTDESRNAIGTLNAGVETFRQKYLSKDKSNVGMFVEDIAKDCLENGQVDLNKLTRRLNSIKEMLVVFGEAYAVDRLVTAFAIAHGVLSQEDTLRQAILTRARELPMTEEAQSTIGFLARARELFNASQENFEEEETSTPQQSGNKATERRAGLRRLAKKAKQSALEVGTRITKANAREGVIQVKNREDVLPILKELHLSDEEITKLLTQIKTISRDQILKLRVFKVSGTDEGKDTYAAKLIGRNRSK